MVVSSIGNGGALAAMAVLLVAMAGGPYCRGFIPQGPVNVESAVSIAVARVAAYGALGSSIEPMYRSALCAFVSKVGLPGARSLVSPEIPVRTAAVSDGSRFPRLSRPLG